LILSFTNDLSLEKVNIKIIFFTFQRSILKFSKKDFARKYKSATDEVITTQRKPDFFLNFSSTTLKLKILKTTAAAALLV